MKEGEFLNLVNGLIAERVKELKKLSNEAKSSELKKIVQDEIKELTWARKKINANFEHIQDELKDDFIRDIKATGIMRD